jgi:hypothetical protein
MTPPDAPAPVAEGARAERRPATIMAFWTIWMPCWIAAPPVSAERQARAWKQMIAITIIRTQ